MTDFWVQWFNSEGMSHPAVPLPCPCSSFEEAAQVAISSTAWEWITDRARFKVWQGAPSPGANFAMFTVGRVRPTPTSPAGNPEPS